VKPRGRHFIREQVELGFSSFNLVKVGQEDFTKREPRDFRFWIPWSYALSCLDKVHAHIFSLAHGAPDARVHVFRIGARQPWARPPGPEARAICPFIYIGTREVEFAVKFENIFVMGFEMGRRGYG
jgi:hypothetical protein